MNRQERSDVQSIVDATAQGYVLFNSCRSMAGIKWERWCRDNDVPCIVVRQYVSRAELRVDFGSKRLTPAGCALVEALVTRKEIPCGWSATHFRPYERLPALVAEEIAADLWVIVSDPENVTQNGTVTT